MKKNSVNRYLGLTVIILQLISFQMNAQNNGNASPNTDIDPSKPTNLYTQVNVNADYTDANTGNLIGSRINIQYAINTDNLILAEIPFFYNDRSEQSGLSDLRIRYFRAVRRNITERFIAIAPFADVSLPTGSFKNGLGSSAYSIAGGCVFGFVASKKLALFPGLSYVHVTAPQSDLIPEGLRLASNGISVQFNASYSFSKRTFLFINPTPLFANRNGVWTSTWLGELNLNHIIKPNKFKMNLYWGPNFTAEIHTYRMGFTVFI